MLDGIRVLSFTHYLQGPSAAQVLGDLGADVIKIERPGEGDETRSWGPPYAGGESAYYLSINRSKRSVALDLKDGRALELAVELGDRALQVQASYDLGRAYEDIGDLGRAAELHRRVLSLTTLGAYSDPPIGAIKLAMKKLGVPISPNVRGPALPAIDEEGVEAVLKETGLLETSKAS